MNDTADAPTSSLEQALLTATNQIRPDVLLLSGGVDSALLAAMWAHHGHLLTCVTVCRDESWTCTSHPSTLALPCGSDAMFAQKVIDHTGHRHIQIRLDEPSALDMLDRTIRLSNSFDLGQLNNVALVAGMMATNATTIATGDDGDGLFAGYRFLQNIDNWPAYLRTRLPNIDPPARHLASGLGMQAVFPFLTNDVMKIATQFAMSDLLQTTSPGEVPSFTDQFAAGFPNWGKMPLRKIAKKWLPSAIAWRPKMDLEFGSGLCALENPLAVSINAESRQHLDTKTMRWFNDAHRGMYLRFLGLGLKIRPPQSGEFACTSCGAGVANGKLHCHTCGAWPANEIVDSPQR